MPEIVISVTGKTAQVRGNPQIICGNSDYTVTFVFDDEWSRYPVKTARVAYWKNGLHLHAPDTAISGNSVRLPALYDVGEAEIGVYAGDVRTTTLARIPCMPCITDSDPQHDDPAPDIYAQLMALLAALKPESGGAPAGVTVPLLHGAVGIGGLFEEV